MTTKLNKFEPTKDFTHEIETNLTLYIYIYNK